MFKNPTVSTFWFISLAGIVPVHVLLHNGLKFQDPLQTTRGTNQQIASRLVV